MLDCSSIDGPRRARLRREQGRPLLFEKFEFCLLDDFASFIAKDKLRALLVACGGTVVRVVIQSTFILHPKIHMEVHPLVHPRVVPKIGLFSTVRTILIQLTFFWPKVHPNAKILFCHM